MELGNEQLGKIANIARGLAIDMIAQAKSGHLGLPLGLAEVGAALFTRGLRIYPDETRAHCRDRFVLSAGHGSAFLYPWLHLCGFKISIDDLKHFRQMTSITPGHPEFDICPGIEATTGPLGQGVANAVGMALSGKMLGENFNRPNSYVFDYKVVCLAGDGCMQEGISYEAMALAGHLRLDNLILIYDANDVTLDALAERTQSEDITQRAKAAGWHTREAPAHDPSEFLRQYEQCRLQSEKPTLLVVRSTIGKGVPQIEASAAAHGEGGIKYIEEARASWSLPKQRFYVDTETREIFKDLAQEKSEALAKWHAEYNTWGENHPELRKDFEQNYQLRELHNKNIFAEKEFGEVFPQNGKNVATRVHLGIALQRLAKTQKNFITGAADLFGSTKNYLQKGGDIERGGYAAKNIWYGVREHAMAGICNGFAYDGYYRPSCATFLVFSDYMRGAIRLSALSSLPVLYIFSHDSVAVGEDGPTHQPIEQVSSLRLLPNLDVWRPADEDETLTALEYSYNRLDAPSAIITTRQNLPALEVKRAKLRRDGAKFGAYVLRKEIDDLRLVLLACGSETSVAVAAATQIAEELGKDCVRVVSMPCMELFERQQEEYRLTTLPNLVRENALPLIAIEAGSSQLWHKYVSGNGEVIGIDTFAFSAPGAEVLESFGFTPETVKAKAMKYLLDLEV